MDLFYEKLERMDYELLVVEGMRTMLGHIRDEFRPALVLSESATVLKNLNNHLAEERKALVESNFSTSSDKFTLPEHGEGFRYRDTFAASDDEGGEEEEEDEAGGEDSVDGGGSASPSVTSGGGGGSGLPDIVTYGRGRTAAK